MTAPRLRLRCRPLVVPIIILAVGLAGSCQDSHADACREAIQTYRELLQSEATPDNPGFSSLQQIATRSAPSQDANCKALRRELSERKKAAQAAIAENERQKAAAEKAKALLAAPQRTPGRSAESRSNSRGAFAKKQRRCAQRCTSQRNSCRRSCGSGKRCNKGCGLQNEQCIDRCDSAYE